MSASDIIVVGGGIAGLSAAAALSRHARVTVLEAEDQIGFHSSGRSATMVHYALGDRLVRALTLASRPFFEAPPEGFTETPIGHRMPVLVHAREDERAALDALDADISRFAELERLDAVGVHQLCPLLREDARYGIADLNGIRLDPNALLQGNLRQLRGRGGELRTGERVARVDRTAGTWTVTSEKGERFSAPVLVNAAGSWADAVAKLAGVRPLGLEPKRRTIITFDAPAEIDLARLPFTKTIDDELYSRRRAVGCSPRRWTKCQASHATRSPMSMKSRSPLTGWRSAPLSRSRVHSKWAGLRTFTPDRHPAAGFVPDAEGFFWLAGQGGFGLQTSPAMAAIVESLIAGTAWPVPDVAREELGPGRFLGQPA